MKYLLKICYDGAQYAGFQRQPGVSTVQGAVEAALSEALGEEIKLSCAGRTDKGVHGLGQVVSFKTANDEAILPALETANTLLQPFVQILQAVESPPGFHPHHSAVSRTYSYYVQGSSSLKTERVWCLADSLDLERMRETCGVFVGEHDFSSFSYRSGNSGNVRTLHRLKIDPVPHNKELFCIQVRGSGFLRKMVRLLVAGIVECGLGLREVEDLEAKLGQRDPTEAPHPAPPGGLSLESVEYDPDPFQHGFVIELGEGLKRGGEKARL
jgi:tRNA pseudouridine38-40 synthase